MLSFEEFEAHYKKYGRYPNDVSNRSKPLNATQLAKRYQKYTQQIEHSQEKKRSYSPLRSSVDEEEQKVFKEVSKRDGGKCRLLCITKEGYDSQKMDYQIIDHAHVYSKAEYPLLKYESLNIVCLNRYAHSNLDSNRDPVTGKRISRDEVKKWWLTILGEKQYTMLQEKVKEKGYKA